MAVIFAAMAGGRLYGFFGILQALPVAAAVMVLIRHMLQNCRDSELYGPAEPMDQTRPLDQA